jgi:hypothetical protein
MQKPKQLQVRWQEARNRDGMLCDTEEKTTLPSESAEHRKPMRDILDANLLGPRIVRKKLLPRVRAQIPIF